ncbi:MFS transporter [Streptomyces sp. AHU1]|uniref:MFS transporter n=1 Tax=Streptomyces sp. AHU1 TaxID=3377215 RepID=UPI003877A962
MTVTSSDEQPPDGEPSDRTAKILTTDACAAGGGGRATDGGSAGGVPTVRRGGPPGAPGPDPTRSGPVAERPPRPVWSRDFALFFVARALARLGETMLPVALAAGLLRYGYGVGAVGLAMAASAAPFAGLVVFGGVIADRFSTRRLMIGADLVRLVAQSIAAALFFTGHVVLWQICVIGAVNGVAGAVFQPGVASTVPRLASDIQGANGAIRIAESAAQLAGPALAGLLVAFASAGGVFVAHAGTFALSALCLLLLRLPPAAPGSRNHGGGFRADLAEGWREFRSRTWLWAVIAIWCVYMISVWGPTVPLVATEVVQRHGPRAYGLVNSALGAGTVVGGLLALRLRPRRMLRAGSVALVTFACFPASVGAGCGVPAVSAAAVIAGAGTSFWGVMWATSVQTQVAPDVLNRIHAYDVAGSLAMMPVGQALAGPAASTLGADNVLLVAGVMSLVVCVALLSVPAIRDLVRADGPAPLSRNTAGAPLGQARRPPGPRTTGARPPA